VIGSARAQLVKVACVLIFFALLYQIAAAQSGWSRLTSPGEVDLVAVYFTSRDKGWVAGDKGFLAVTEDGGRTWRRVELNTTEDVNEIYFRNDKNGYLVAGRKMFLTTDGGQTWNETRIYRPGEFRNLTPEFLSIRFADKKRGIAVGSLLRKGRKEEMVVESLVMRTEDGGENWSRVVVPTKSELFHLDFDGSSRVWIVGDGGVILFSGDGGRTFVRQNTGTRQPIYNVDFRDSKNGYAVGKAGTILRTENGGETWENVQTHVTESLMRVDFADDKNGWIVGYQGTILRSSDKGRTWIRQESGTTENFYGLFMSKKYGWAVGAKGQIFVYTR